ncbi:MAG: gliding motility-associated C-terminal domain-containing protein [Bacteroidetes bacterium]|nr:gliding motility-associated C-terminal domain-containing protein [Bacteroidota bacterium]
MRTNLFAAILLFALPVTTLMAQQSKKAAVAQPKQVVSDHERNYAAYFEQNKDMLEGFNEAELVKSLRAKNMKELAISEFVAGQKIKYIKKKMGINNSVSAPFVNKTLSSCDNIGYSYLDFTNWSGRLGDVSNSTWGACSDPIDTSLWNLGYSLGVPGCTPPGTTSGIERHTIVYGSGCFDPIAIDPSSGLPMIPYDPPGPDTVCARLGNQATGAETERLTYLIEVTPANSQLIYQYAVVYENPAAHAFDEQPFFFVSVTDSNGVLVNSQSGNTCGQFCFFADPNDTSFVSINNGAVLAKRWTSVGVDLSSYVGQTVKLEFTTGDCSLSGHWGYAYVHATCSKQQASVSICPNDTIGYLVAPPGYATYEWLDGNGISLVPPVLDDTLKLINPQIGAHYIASLGSLSALGCETQLDVFILNYSYVPVQTTVLNLLCNGVTTGNATAIVDSSILHGPFSYQWFNAQGAIPNATNPVYNTNLAGTYWVKVLNAGGCGNFLPDTAVVSSIPDYTLSPNPLQLNLCLGQQAIIHLNPILTPGTTITTNWQEFATNNLNSTTDTVVTYTANAIGPDTVVYICVSNYGCIKTDTLFVNVSGSYIADGTAIGGDTLCVGDTTQLDIKFAPASPENCGLLPSNINCTMPVVISQVGNGTTTNTANILASAYPSPFGNFRLNSKQQYLYRASELQAAGIKGGYINSLAFYVKTLAPVTTYNNYTVRMHCSTLSALTTDFDTALAEVYHPKPFHVIQGWNSIDFDQSYAWDGVSSLVVEICMDANTGGTQQNCAVENTSTNFISSTTISNFGNPVCSVLGGATPSQKRPNTRFSVCGIKADTSRFNYSWTPTIGLSDPTIINPVASPSTSTYYIVTINDTVNGCSDTAGVYVYIPAKNVSFIADTLEGGTPLTINFTNTSNTSIQNFFWNYGDTFFDIDTVYSNHSHTFYTAGEYTVSLIGTNSNGCTDTAVIVIRALTSELKVPNVFTPNSDGVNDEFILDAPGIETFSGIIFNRWGKKVFEWTDPTQGWTGKDAKDGVYYYVIKAKGVDGQEFSNEGHVTLTR